MLTDRAMKGASGPSPMARSMQFTNRKGDAFAMEPIFDRVYREHGIEHRLTKVRHSWTNGQVERMNRMIKDATVKRFHYDTHEQLRSHLQCGLR